jgi:hypothetical protein
VTSSPELPSTAFTAADPEIGRSERTAVALFRIAERHASSPQARARQVHETVVAAHEAVRLITFLAGGIVEADPDEPGVDQDDLLAALTLVPAARHDLEQVEAALLAAARGHGLTWAQIAFGLGLRSSQAAQQRYDRLTGRVGDVSPA